MYASSDYGFGCVALLSLEQYVEAKGVKSREAVINQSDIRACLI